MCYIQQLLDIGHWFGVILLLGPQSCCKFENYPKFDGYGELGHSHHGEQKCDSLMGCRICRATELTADCYLKS